MSVSRTLLFVSRPLSLVAVAPSAPASAAASGAKKSKKGYEPTTVKKGARKKRVCRTVKRKAGPAGPSVAEVEAIIRGIHQARHETWLGPESMEVTFQKPTRILPVRKYDPYAADALNAAGPVPAWPVLAYVKVVNKRDDTPDDDTKWDGCLGHLNSWWPYDTLIMFFRGDSGEWTFLTSTDDRKECG